MSTQASSVPYDYTGCTFEVRLTKKKFLHSVLRYVYFAKDRLIVCKEPYQPKPEKVIPITNRMSIRWIYERQKLDRPFKDKALGFYLLSDKEEIAATFYGDQVIMTSLLDFLGKQIFQSDFLQEYEILQKIGKGKYAKVYKVRRKDSGEFFAVKYLHKRKMKDIDDSEAALDNELNILRAINHPNCLKLVACYQDNVGYYILTELLDETKSLQQEIVKYRNPQFSYQMTKHILSSLLKGLEYIHSKGIMHRDLKPQNIMFAQSQSGTLSSLKLIDFGLAQFINAKKYIYVHVGTPGFVAPEILANESENHRYDEKCDLFSIGVIFHTLLTGKTVFSGTKFSQVLEKNKLCQIQLTGPRYEQLSTEALDLLNRLLQRDPVRRLSATQALQHSFFSDKGIDVDKMPSATEQGTQVQRTKLLNGLKEQQQIPKIPGHKNSASSNQEYEMNYNNNYSASPTMLRNTLLHQVNQLKPMREIDANSMKSTLPTQVEALYKFSRDLLILLEDIEANKESLLENEEDDYSPVKLNHKISDQMSPVGTPSNQDQDFQNRPQLFAFSSNKRGKENSLIHPIKIQVEGMGECEQEDDEDENGPSKGAKHGQRKNLFVNTNLDRQGQALTNAQNQGQNGDAAGDGNAGTEQKIKQFEDERTNGMERPGNGDASKSPVFSPPKSHFPANNMILNEISSPISPPTKAMIQNKKMQANKMEKDQVEAGDHDGMHPLNLNDGKIGTNGTATNSATKFKYPKEIVQLIEFFPKDMFACYLNHDKAEIQKGMASRVQKLGLFLLFGAEVLNQPAPSQIEDRLKEVQEKKIFHQWFINMIKSMVSPQESDRPTLNELNKVIADNFKPS